MWAIEYIPEIVIHLMFLVGVLSTIVGFLTSFVPFIGKYVIVVRIVGVLLLTSGVYLEGGLENSKIWKIKVANLESKIKTLEIKSQKENIVIQEKVVTKIQTIRQKGDTVIKYIDKIVVKNNEIIKYIENCPLPKEIILIHNQAATINEPATEVKK